MKNNLRFPVFLFALILFLASALIGSEVIPIEVAKRAAEYHGELIFEKDLKICDYELMHWPWGEPAVYVFTLMREQDFYPGNILLDNTLLQGAYLASANREEEGYLLMTQTDRYMTIFVGATTDMSSFIKAHAGLPEHVLALVTMENPPLDPYWIYGGLFYIFVTSQIQVQLGEVVATEIHLEKEVALKDLGKEKIGTIPPYAQQIEWARFLHPDAPPLSEENLYLANIKGVIEGKHELPVKELNTQGKWVGCAPAAFYNCLKYLESQGKVNTQGKGINVLLNWIAICHRTDPANGGTFNSWLTPGAEVMFKGLGYYSTCTKIVRQASKPGLFVTQFADEINSEYPCNLGGTGKGIFDKHSTTGIGYWKEGTHIRLIIHDGWKTTKGPVYVKYLGYPEAELEYPLFMIRFHPGGKENYPEAEPKLDVAEKLRCNPTTDKWTAPHKVISENEVGVEAYANEMLFFDIRGRKYNHIKPKRLYPYLRSGTLTFSKPAIVAGRAQLIYLVVDSNGHLLKAKANVKLVEAPVGTWHMVYDWKNTDDGPPVDWYIYEDGKAKDSDGSPGTWTINRKNFTFSYQTGNYAVYTGTTNTSADRMNGTMRDNRNSGTWNATRRADSESSVSQDSRTGELKSKATKADGSLD